MADLDTPVPAPDPTPAPADPPVPVAPADPDEASAVEVGGEKMVPLSALKAARSEAKGFKQQAGQYEQFLVENAPYLKVLKENPNLFQQAAQPREAPAPSNADPELVELARSLDYYDKNGAPDLERAQKHQTIIRREASRMAQQMVAPLAQSNAQQTTQATFAKFANTKLPNGQQINPQTLAKYFGALAQNGVVVNDQVGYAAWSLAGMEQMQGSPLPAQPAAPGGPPLHTENVGSVPRRPQQLSEVERLVMQARGLTDKTYNELTKGFSAGRSSSLED